MLVYLPYYDRGRKVIVIESSKALYRKTPGYDAVITYHFTEYNGEHIFTTEAAAFAWWNREVKACEPFRIEWEDIKQ